MKTQSFKKGFIDGFLSPFSFILQKPVKTSKKTTIDAAWEEVGTYIFESYNNEVEELGKRDKKTK